MKIILKRLNYIVNLTYKLIHLLTNNDLIMGKAVYNKNGRYILYYAKNNKLLPHKDILLLIFNRLKQDNDFLNFGYKKVMIITAIVNNHKYSFHHNVLLTNNSTFIDYYNQIEEYITNIYNDDLDYANNIDSIPMFEIKIWNIDNSLNRNIKKPNTIIPKNRNKTNEATNVNASSYLNKFGFNYNKYSIHGFQLLNSCFYSKQCIKPIINKKVDQILDLKLFSTFDIETITIKELDNLQVPISISYCNSKESGLFLIDDKLLKIAIDNLDNNKINQITLDMFENYFNYLTTHVELNEIIFAHNLGSFDGVFLYKYLLKSKLFKLNEITTIIDNHNKFITIKIDKGNFKILFKDSYRIFPVSLNSLCKNFNILGKTNDYNPLFNAFSLFSNLDLLSQFKEYSIQDSNALFKAMESAQEIYNLEYKVDICDIFSTSTLSLKIFRQKFLKLDIPILKGTEDNFIRKGYYGGATDYYKAYGKDLYYYDVNSLYPFAMKKPMPFNLIRIVKKNININNFFGFINCDVICPEELKIPILPVKYQGKTIFPKGSWNATYFSEEIKIALTLGYKFTYKMGYEYSKADLFSNYVDYFYNKKKHATGSSRFIAKMHLNQLYGYFGRKLTTLETVNIHKDELISYLTTRIVKSIIEIDENTFTLLLIGNLNHNLLSDINNSITLDIKNNYSFVKSNVCIAAAVTSYARIHMIPFKLNTDCYYSDTDSIFTSTKLSSDMLGKDLGLMKDELDGKLIKEAYFLGIKQYGYYYYDENNNKVEQSTFAGVTRNSISFQDITNLHLNKELKILAKDRFFKSIKQLNINYIVDV